MAGYPSLQVRYPEVVSVVATDLERYYAIYGTGPVQTVLSASICPMGRSGSWWGTGYRVNANTRNAEATLQSYTTNGAGNQIVTIPAGGSNIYYSCSADQSDNIPSDVDVWWQLSTVGGTGNITPRGAWSAFTAEEGCYSRIVDSSLLATVAYNDVLYTGGPESSDVESRQEQLTFVGGTLERLTIRCYAFSLTGGGGTLTVVSRVNTVDGNQAISITGTGNFNDVNNTDDIVPGDKYCMKLSTDATGGSYSVSVRGFGLYNTGSQFQNSVAGQASVLDTNYFSPLCSNTTNGELSSISSPFAFTASMLSVNVSADAAASASVTFRANSDNKITTEIPSGSSGWFTNTSDTYVVQVGDLINYQMLRSDANISVRGLSLMGYTWTEPAYGYYSVSIRPTGAYPMRIGITPLGTPVRIVKV